MFRFPHSFFGMWLQYILSILLQFAGTRGIYCEQHLTNRIRSGKPLVYQPIKIINAIVSFLITVIPYAINKNRIFMVHFIYISSAIRKVAAWDLASANCWCWKIANCNLASVCVWQKHRWRWRPLPEVRQSPFFWLDPNDWPLTIQNDQLLLRSP